MRSILSDQTILITGGTGSLGQKFTEIALEHEPKAIRIFSRNELLQVEMERRFHDSRLRFFIGDVRDKERLHRAIQGVDLVIHAAALKHIPVCEYNPIEAIRTNVVGTVNLIECAIDSEVDKAILISTDKACQPLNLYGATKSVAEKLFIQANSYTGGKSPYFSVVRYGNVLGSRGSLIPLLLEQIPKGTVTLTDSGMTRFWISLDQGVYFVILCLEQMVGGEIFIPKLPAMKILDLIHALAPTSQIQTIGIRPGEKLAEVLLTEDEARHTKEFETYFVVEPEFNFWRKETLIGGGPLPPGFQYSSDRVSLLSAEELIQLLPDYLSSA